MHQLYASALTAAHVILQGSILMDGVDLLTLGLQEVRGRIAAIPQVRTPGHPTLDMRPERADTPADLSTCSPVHGPQLRVSAPHLMVVCLPAMHS